MSKEFNVSSNSASASLDAILESHKLRRPVVSDYSLLPHPYMASAKFTSFEPTPIAPNGVAAVPRLPLEFALLSSDLSQINVFQQLFSPAQLQAHHQQIVHSAHVFPEANFFPPVARSSTLATPQPVAAKAENVKYGPRHIEQWNLRFQELVGFQKKHGHCLVPMYDHTSPKLSNWVKRQRNQHRLKIEGKHSTLCDNRQKALEDLGFVWDSHAACWDERYKELRQFWRENGHSKVPKSYKKNPSLSVWVKCQRRQFKLLQAGKPSYISEERIRLLKELSFDFNPRRDSVYSQARGRM